jgi:hypothetical protein
MDAFKAVEIQHMKEGGNSVWREFFGSAEGNVMAGITWVLPFSCSCFWGMFALVMGR